MARVKTKDEHRLTIIVATLVAIVTLFLFFVGHTRGNRSVSLVFQRYSELDPYVGDVAFLWLTNASDKPYLVSMPGHTNTQVSDNYWQRGTSWLVNCEFRDQTPTGWTNWIQMPSSSRGSNAYLSLGAHSGMLIRVPLQWDGQKRKVAVLVEKPLAISKFWETSFGFGVFRMLPQSMQQKVILPPPDLLKVWCDRELSYPGEKNRTTGGGR